jgi:hypothetical protein
MKIELARCFVLKPLSFSIPCIDFNFNDWFDYFLFNKCFS